MPAKPTRNLVMGSPSIASQAEACIATISGALTELEDINLGKLSGTSLIDVGARINAQTNSLSDINDRLKDQVKLQALTNNPGSNSPTLREKGKAYQANVNRAVRVSLITDKVKSFLGTRLSQFQTKKKVTSVTYGIAE